jgi:predicted acylesterase/phospholipase RssA
MTEELSEYKSQKHRPNQEAKDLALAVAISGGGHRAANFGIGVLLALEEHGILKEVDYLSTVSGGSFAGAAYIESLISHLEMEKPHESYSLKTWLEQPGELAIDEDDSLKRHLERGYTSRLVWGLLNPIYWLGEKDRGDVLEKKIDDRLLGLKRRKKSKALPNERKRSLTLSDVFCYKNNFNGIEQNACKYMVPYWVSNATIYTNGAIFPFAPDLLERYKVVQYTHRGWREKLGDDKTRLPLAVAVKASASFPVAVPPTTLKSDYQKDTADGSNLYLQLLDGGLADNIGVHTAISLLEKDDCQKKVLLIVDAYKGESHPFSFKEAAPSGLAIGLKTTTMGLNASHVRLEDDVRRMCPNCGIVFLNFETLTLEDVFRKVTQKQGMDQVESRKVNNMEGYKTSQEYNEYLEARNDLYEDIRDVDTAFNVSKKEQKLLITAGKEVVNNKIHRIKSLIWDN